MNLVVPVFVCWIAVVDVGVAFLAVALEFSSKLAAAAASVVVVVAASVVVVVAASVVISVAGVMFAAAVVPELRPPLAEVNAGACSLQQFRRALCAGLRSSRGALLSYRWCCTRWMSCRRSGTSCA